LRYRVHRATLAAVNLTFAQPLWLLGLLPVLLLGAWLLIGQPTPATVPFLNLWPRRRVGPTSRARRRLPPIAVLLIWIALLLAAMALAMPQWRQARGALPVTVIIDGGTGVSDARQAANIASLASTIADPRIGLNVLRGDGSATRETIDALSPRDTLTLTESTLRSRLASRLRESDDLIVVISDRAMEIDLPRVFRITAGSPLINSRVVRIAGAHGQAMIEVESSSPDAGAIVARIAAEQTLDVEIPLSGGRGVAFIPLPGAMDSIGVQLLVEDDVPADDTATLERVARSARPEQDGELPAPIVRFLQAYRAERGADRSAMPVRVTTSDPGDGPALRVSPTIADAPAAVQDHAILRGLSAGSLPIGGLAGSTEGWAIIADIGGRPAIAVRSVPAAQVWIGLDIERAATSPEAIALLTRAIDWAAGTERVAYRMVDRDLPELAGVDEASRARLREAIANLRPADAHTPLAPWISIAVIAVLLGALLVARR
jgi:hypothetical protein